MELYREQGDLDRAVLRIEAIYDFIIFGNCIMPIDDIYALLIGIVIS
jgi:hypothetical protein